jgi:hypothetical protein
MRASMDGPLSVMQPKKPGIANGIEWADLSV